MRKLTVFNSVSLDGYFTDARGDMSWAHRDPDPEWDAFVGGNAQSGGTLLFGRRTYEMMASFWPTPAAERMMPDVARGMNACPKVVFSRTLRETGWSNTRLATGDLADAVKRLKAEPGSDMVILGSGSIVAQLAVARLIDAYQFVSVPVALGAGRTLFDGLKARLALKRVDARPFANGNVVATYVPA